jgi:hypothetical protein
MHMLYYGLSTKLRGFKCQDQLSLAKKFRFRGAAAAVSTSYKLPDLLPVCARLHLEVAGTGGGISMVRDTLLQHIAADDRMQNARLAD